MLHCFFGAELKPDGVAVNFTVPKDSNLVITHCAVTSVMPPPLSNNDAAGGASSSTASFYSPVTLCVQHHGEPVRYAVCTLSPAQQITCCPVQLLFSKPVSFALVPQTVTVTPAASSTTAAPLRHIGGKSRREPPQGSGRSNRNNASVSGAAATAMVYPTVHLTGYYEKSAEEEDDTGAMAMEGMEDDEDFSEDD